MCPNLKALTGSNKSNKNIIGINFCVFLSKIEKMKKEVDKEVTK